MSSAFRRLLTGVIRIVLVLSCAVLFMVLAMGPAFLAAVEGSNWWLLCYAPAAAVLSWVAGSKDFDWDY